MQKEFKKKFQLNSTLIYNPLENEKIIQKKSKEKIINKHFQKKFLNILTIGRLVKQKDHITLIKSLRFIDPKINYRLLIIGDGEEKIKILDIIKNKNLQKKVKIINFQNNIYPYINQADIFILTSIFDISLILISPNIGPKFFLNSTFWFNP